MALTLNNLVADVSAELQNHKYYGTATFTATGDTYALSLAPLGSYIVDDVTFTIQKNGSDLAETTDFTMDFSTGVLSLVAAAVATDVITAQFNYQFWPTSLVEQAVESGVRSLFPNFYVSSITEVSSDGDAYEYECTATDPQFIKQIDFKGSSDTKYTRIGRGNWEQYWDGEDLWVRFYTEPAAGTIRFHTIDRPAVGTVTERAKDAIISYACFYLLTQKLAPRVRSDIAVVTQGAGVVYPNQMRQAGDAFFMRYQFQVQQNKMPPWLSR